MHVSVKINANTNKIYNKKYNRALKNFSYDLLCTVTLNFKSTG